MVSPGCPGVNIEPPLWQFGSWRCSGVSTGGASLSVPEMVQRGGLWLPREG